MFEKKSGLSKLKTYKKKMDKKAVKMTKGFLKDSVAKKSRFYHNLVKWPRRMEWITSILFLVVVCVLFYKKSKDPDFLSNFGEIKL